MPVAVHVPVTGSYSSALLNGAVPYPAATSTWPEGTGRGVSFTAKPMLPVAAHDPVAGSYRSALLTPTGVSSTPPATRPGLRAAESRCESSVRCPCCRSDSNSGRSPPDSATLSPPPAATVAMPGQAWPRPQLPMHRILPHRAIRIDQPRPFDLHSLRGLLGKTHFAFHQFHPRPGAHSLNSYANSRGAHSSCKKRNSSLRLELTTCTLSVPG